MLVEIEPEIEAQLAAEAQSRGLSLTVYIIEKLREPGSSAALTHFPVPRAGDSLREHRNDDTETRDRAVDAMLQFAPKHRFNTGGQSIESMLHEGHKY